MYIHSIGLDGIEGYVIEVAVKILGGVSQLNIIGLGDLAIKEAKDRVAAAIMHYGFKYPKGKLVISLAPCDLKKSGSYLDLAMVVALLLESEQIEARDKRVPKTAFFGAVGLCGELLGFRGVLPMVVFAKQMGFKTVIVPTCCLDEASICSDIEIIALESVKDVLKWVEQRLAYTHRNNHQPLDTCVERVLDYAQVDGQEELLECVLAAAAGGHNMLLIGPPGCGKSMIAKRLPTILPKLTNQEALEVMALHSLSGKSVNHFLNRKRPFRAPHYNASPNAIIGGGTRATPGEVSLAHHGVLFLDELPEFSPRVIDSLRQPLEDGVVTVARVKTTNTYPAMFMLVGAMNPCKCGHYGYARCDCTPAEVKKYQRRVSGPVYDRIDIQKFLIPTPTTVHKNCHQMTSASMRKRVLKARAVQQKRFEGIPGVSSNAHMKDELVKEFCHTSEEARVFLDAVSERHQLSRRAYDKLLILARTYADLCEEELIDLQAIKKAIQSRDLDREVKWYG